MHRCLSLFEACEQPSTKHGFPEPFIDSGCASLGKHHDVKLGLVGEDHARIFSMINGDVADDVIIRVISAQCVALRDAHEMSALHHAARGLRTQVEGSLSVPLPSRSPQEDTRTSRVVPTRLRQATYMAGPTLPNPRKIVRTARGALHACGDQGCEASTICSRRCAERSSTLAQQ